MDNKKSVFSRGVLAELAKREKKSYSAIYSCVVYRQDKYWLDKAKENQIS